MAYSFPCSGVGVIAQVNYGRLLLDGGWTHLFIGTRDQKNWSPTEGFRKVNLNARFNRFLLRLENGWQGTMFSVVMELE